MCHHQHRCLDGSARRSAPDTQPGCANRRSSPPPPGVDSPDDPRGEPRRRVWIVPSCTPNDTSCRSSSSVTGRLQHSRPPHWPCPGRGTSGEETMLAMPRRCSNFAAASCLRHPGCVQRNVGAALAAALGIPVRLTVTEEPEGAGGEHAQSASAPRPPSRAAPPDGPSSGRNGRRRSDGSGHLGPWHAQRAGVEQGRIRHRIRTGNPLLALERMVQDATGPWRRSPARGPAPASLSASLGVRNWPAGRCG